MAVTRFRSANAEGQAIAVDRGARSTLLRHTANAQLPARLASGRWAITVLTGPGIVRAEFGIDEEHGSILGFYSEEGYRIPVSASSFRHLLRVVVPHQADRFELDREYIGLIAGDAIAGHVYLGCIEDGMGFHRDENSAPLRWHGMRLSA